MTPLEQLHALRARGGARRTLGLPDDVVAAFLDRDPKLARAIELAVETVAAAREDLGEVADADEHALIAWLQEGLVQFYDAATVNPYVAAGACGPWIVTSRGAVVHDSGGYGMIGQGHAPFEVLDVLARPWVMANVMTPSFSQRRFTEAMRAEVGHARGYCPFHRFICMNSGSESVTVAHRISDANALVQTRPGGANEGRRPRILALSGGFHGRTDSPARASDSSLPVYRKHLYSYQEFEGPITVEPNDVAALEQAFAQAEERGEWIELLLVEPVMGEGKPGHAITRAFYDKARELTQATGGILLVDSIQAGLRAQGVLSIVDYPGFEDCAVPDIETWSKAINGGQYPLSVLGLSERAAGMYVRGIYGNTMTTNPRALEVAAAVLQGITPSLRANIRERGAELVEKLADLAHEFPGAVKGVQGTGLLLAIELDPDALPVVAFGGVEEYCRVHGLGVIHGGQNALRFTPHFALTSEEVDLMVGVVRQALNHFLVSGRAQPVAVAH